MAIALPSTLTQLERSVLTLALDHPGEPFASVSAQLAHATVSQREHTGVGFFTTFSIPPDAPVSHDLPDTELGGVSAEHPDVRYGVGFILFIRRGAVACLEAYTYDDPWPEDESKFRAFLDASKNTNSNERNV